MKKLLLYILALFAFFGSLRSQEQAAFVQIYNTYRISSDVLSFQLIMGRSNENWYKFANGTYQLQFSDGSLINSALYRIDLISSDLKLATVAGGDDLQKDAYTIDPVVFNDRFSITIVGPETLDDCASIPTDETVLLGEFQISSKDGATVPDVLVWKTPLLFYQACAYKTDKDSLDGFITRFTIEDNIEMHDEISSYVDFKTDDSERPAMRLVEFTAQYVGGKNVKLDWRTDEEAYNKGFIVRRAPRPDMFQQSNELVYNHEVSSFTYDNRLLGAGTTKQPQTYEYYYDSVEYRGGDYCYELLYEDFEGNVTTLAYACAPVPNAVIVYAAPSENPFRESTRIDYIVDDDVTMTVTVYELGGKEITKLSDESGQLLDGVVVKKGEHSTTFNASELSSQGMYDVIFIAYPIDDPSVELSRAVVKLQLMR
jgi:hypothetical protein